MTGKTIGGEVTTRLGESTHVFLPLPAAGGWIQVDENKKKVIDDLAYKSEEKLETPLFFTTDPEGKRKASQVEAFDNGTAFSSMAAYLFSPLILWLGAQIGKNASISDRAAGALTLIELERLINVTDRILSWYVIGRLLGPDTDKGKYKPPEVPPEMPLEGYVGGGVGGKMPPEAPPEVKEGEALPEKYRKMAEKLIEKIKKYFPEEIKKLKSINDLKKYISKDSELAREYETLLRKIVSELVDYEGIMAALDGISYGDMALRKCGKEIDAYKEIDSLPLQENTKNYAKAYIRYINSKGTGIYPTGFQYYIGK